MFWKKKLDSKEVLQGVVEDIAAMDIMYPGAKSSALVRRLRADDHFNIEERPWDFLIMLGYSICLLHDEIMAVDKNEIRKLRAKICKAMRKSDKWLISVITPEVRRRYAEASGKFLPEAGIDSGRTDDYMYSYAEMFYTLKNLCCGAYIIDVDEEYSLGIPTPQSVRTLVLSMEQPPQYVLTELNQRIIKVNLDELARVLKLARKYAKQLGELGYKAPSCEFEIRWLEEILHDLGHPVNLTKETENVGGAKDSEVAADQAEVTAEG